MLESFRDYFRTIEMPDAAQGRAEKLASEFQSLIPGKTDHVFVSDGYDLQGARRYFSLWMSSGHSLMECKNVLVSDNIDFMNLKDGVVYVEVTKTELQDVEKQTTPKSTINVKIALGRTSLSPGAAVATVHAAHNNCSYLVNFLKTMFLDQLIRGT